MSGAINLGEAFKQYTVEEGAVPAGTYQLEVASCAAKVSQNGNPMLTPVFKVVPGTNPSYPQGRRLLAGTFALTENSKNIFFRNMAGFGLDKTYWDQSPTLQDAANALVGRVVNAEVAVEQYMGTDRNKIEIGRIQLVSAPPLPAIGAAPIGGATAASVPAPVPTSPAAPVPATAAAPAPAAAAPPQPTVVEAPAAAPVAPVSAPQPAPVAVADEPDF